MLNHCLDYLKSIVHGKMCFYQSRLEEVAFCCCLSTTSYESRRETRFILNSKLFITLEFDDIFKDRSKIGVGNYGETLKSKIVAHPLKIKSDLWCKLSMSFWGEIFVSVQLCDFKILQIISGMKVCQMTFILTTNILQKRQGKSTITRLKTASPSFFSLSFSFFLEFLKWKFFVKNLYIFFSEEFCSEKSANKARKKQQHHQNLKSLINALIQFNAILLWILGMLCN